MEPGGTKWRRRGLLAVIIAGLSASACATIPGAAPELSVELGARIKETRTAHLQLVRLYMDAKRAQVDRFVMEEWLPEFTNSVFEQAAVQTAWEQASTAKDPGLRMDFIRQLGPRVQKRLNEKRVELVRPLDEMELEITRRLEDHYNEMFAMNATLTGLLSAGASASDTQKRILASLKVQDELKLALGKVETATALITSGTDSLEKHRLDLDKLIQDVRAGAGHD